VGICICKLGCKCDLRRGPECNLFPLAALRCCGVNLWLIWRCHRPTSMSLVATAALVLVLVKGRSLTGEGQGAQGYILCGCVVAGKLKLALCGQSLGGPHASGERCEQKGDLGYKRG